MTSDAASLWCARIEKDRTDDEVLRAIAHEVQRQFELVKAREHARVESLRASKVVPHARGEVES